MKNKKISYLEQEIFLKDIYSKDWKIDFQDWLKPRKISDFRPYRKPGSGVVYLPPKHIEKESL